METIKIADIKNETMKLVDLIEEYELNMLNLYNELNKSENYWKDGNATSFYKDTELDKTKVNNTINEINEIKNIYKYIGEKYSNLGNKIEFNLKYKNKVITELNEYITSISSIIKEYESLDLSFCPYEAKYLKEELFEFQKIKKELTNYKTNIEDKFDYIEETEKKIKNKISKIGIETIKEIDISEYI